MSHFIPLVRAGAILPLVRWATEAGGPINDLLRQVDLGCVVDGRADRPIPLLLGLQFFRLMAEREGPDIAARALRPDSIAELGLLGRVILSSSTIGEALDRLVRALPKHSTHEHITLQRQGQIVRLTLGWSLKIGETDLHLTQQFAAALVRDLCNAAAPAGTALKRIALHPHPKAGLAHLEPHFGPIMVVSDRPVLEIDIDVSVLERQLPGSAGILTPDALEWESLKGDGSFSASARHVLRAMLSDPPASLQRLARAAGMSNRSVQRLLAAEKTTFRQMLDETRRDHVMGVICGAGALLTAASAEAGYSSASAVNHAVRRWTGLSPTNLVLLTGKPPVDTAAE